MNFLNTVLLVTPRLLGLPILLLNLFKRFQYWFSPKVLFLFALFVLAQRNQELLLYALFDFKYIWIFILPIGLIKVNANSMAKLFVIYSLIGILYSLINGHGLMRWQDHVPWAFGLRTVYFWWPCLLLYHYTAGSWRKNVMLLLILLNGSGTGIMGLGAYYIWINRFSLIRPKALIFLASGVIIFYQAQLARGRVGVDLLQIDRVLLWYSAIVVFLENKILFLLPDTDFFLTRFESEMKGSFLIDYLLAEHNGDLTVSMTHSDILRVLISFGIGGLLVIYSRVIKLFPFPLVLALIISGITNPILNSTIFLITLLFNYENNKFTT